MFTRNFLKRNSRRIIIMAGLVFAVSAVLSAVSFALTEEVTIHIFPGSVASEGWEAPEASLSQNLSGRAEVSDFTAKNSASVVFSAEEVVSRSYLSETIVDARHSLPGHMVRMPALIPQAFAQDILEPEPLVSYDEEEATGTEMQDESDTESMQTSDDVEDTAYEEVVAEEVPEVATDTNDAATTSAPVSDPGTTTDEMPDGATTTDEIAETVTAPSSGGGGSATRDRDDDITICSIRNEPCYLMHYSDFSIGESIPQHTVKNIQLRLSLGGEADSARYTDDKLMVRYRYRGEWYMAGEVAITEEVSNAQNGGHFLFALPYVTSWRDLDDLEVQLELVRQSSAWSNVYVDGVWLDTRYVVSRASNETVPDHERALTLLGSEEESGSTDILRLPDGRRIDFLYSDSFAGESLHIRTHQRQYTSEGDIEVFFNVTNTDRRATDFSVAVSSVAPSAEVVALERYDSALLETVATASEGIHEVAFFCEAGWAPFVEMGDEEPMVSEGAAHEEGDVDDELVARDESFMCAVTETVETCARLNADATNCITERSMEAPATPHPFTVLTLGAFNEPSRAFKRTVPDALVPLVRTEEFTRVESGSTAYFRMVLRNVPFDTHGDFAIEAFGSRPINYGAAGPVRTRAEREVLSDERNAELWFTEHVLAGQDPVFWFRYESKKSLWRKLQEAMFGSSQHAVLSLRLVHASGREIVVPYTIEYGREGAWAVKFEEVQKKLHPGRYTLYIEIEDGGTRHVEEKTFYWGVLAVNTDQSVYALGDDAYLTLAALSDTGNTICDADLELTITNPSGSSTPVTVLPSGACDGNNVTTIPDYEAFYAPTAIGQHVMEVVHYDADGAVLHEITDSFRVASTTPVKVVRTGPTRIYPLADYTMTLDVSTEDGFVGQVVEIIPDGFEIIVRDGAELVEKGDSLALVWDVDLSPHESFRPTYSFNAPNISPFLFFLGPLTLEADDTIIFSEERQWQIASDETGNMLILWDGGAAPDGWECVSCNPGEPFYQRFIRGNNTYGATGGVTMHTHTVSTTVFTTTSTDIVCAAGTGVAATGHTHTLTPTISNEDTLPEYRQLRVLRRVNAGTPATLPAGAIVFFKGAVPSSEWAQYSAQDGYYIRGENTVGTTGGSNTHSHTVTGTTGASGGASCDTEGGGPPGNRRQGATDSHTHTVSGSTDVVNHEPPYREVILGRLNVESAPPAGIVAMWDDVVPPGWVPQSQSGNPFFERFPKPATTYGATGGATTHAHADLSLTLSGPSADVQTRVGSGGANDSHSHNVDITSFSSPSHLPPYIDVVFGEFFGLVPVFTQDAFRWYVNEDAEPPTDPWPPGSTNLLENEPITATSTRVKNGDVLRLRMNLLVGNSTSTAGSDAFTLQYGAGDACAAVSSWSDVGGISSSEVWRGYNNASVDDGDELTTLVLASSTIAGTYEEENNSTTTPNDIGPGGYVEYDWVLQQNGALGGTNYCFRMINEDNSALFGYTRYPSVYTNETPDIPISFYPFDNEKRPETRPTFDFVSSDGEGENIHYNIQIATDPTFGSTVINHDSTGVNFERFVNLVIPNDPAPFNSGQRIRYTPPASTLTNGTTYWWRVRARDVGGSTVWSDWSTSTSVTIDTGVETDTWFQTQDEQFERGTLSGVVASGDSVVLSATPGTGTIYSPRIDFSLARIGSVWGELLWNDTEPTNSGILYQVEYFTSTSSWALVPNADLSGNSAGFGTSPVSLGSLDAEAYPTIRVRANLTSTGGSPSLQNWTVDWGTRVDTPTLFTPFDNEQIATTTPIFEFETSDPQGDTLTYQIEWSTDATFTSGVTTRTSDTHSASFANVDTPADTDPFISGDRIRYTLPGADALSNNTTYYWRVRARDAGGADVYSLWSEPFSLTVDTTTDVSTWFQTEAAQFGTNILSGVQTIGNGVTVATTTGNALIAYGEGTETAPRYRHWNGSVWGIEETALSVGAPINYVVTRAGTTRDEYVMATIGTNSDVIAQVYIDGEWGNQTTLTAALANPNKRGVDIAYETLSGDALVVTCDNDSNPSYYVWNGSSWSGPSTITTLTTSNCEWIKLASSPDSDEIILVTSPSGGGQYEAQVWNGSTWGSQTTWGNSSEGQEGIGLSYASISGDAVAAVANDAGPPNRMVHQVWTTVWGGTNNNNVGGFEYGRLASDPVSNNMMLCFIDDATDVEALPWTGADWGTQVQLDAAAHAKNDRAVDCAYEATGGRVIAIYSDTTASRYRIWNGTTWLAEESVSTIGRSATVQLTRTGDGKLLGVFFDHINGRYDFSFWNGTSWSTAQTLEPNASVGTAPYKEPFMVAAQNPLAKGVMRTSPIVFANGTGQKWEAVSWSDTTPGASEIIYQVQYWTGSAWTLIPNADLAGNSTGTSVSPIDISGLNTTTYGQIRIVATLSCDGSNCPTLNDLTVEWAAGAAISGTIQEFDQATNVTSGTVGVAVNGTLQVGRTGAIASGVWEITNVPMATDDIITIFVDGAATDANRATTIFTYNGVGDVSGVSLYENHLTLGIGATETLTNTNISSYDNSVSSDSDIFFDVAGGTLTVCMVGTCGGTRLLVRSATTYRPSGASTGNVIADNIEIRGTLQADGNTLTVGGSWRNSGVFTANTSSVVFSATSGTRSVNSTGASSASFYNATFGSGASTATWELDSSFVASNNLTLSQGTLSPGASPLNIAGNLAIGASGAFQKGSATTTFDGAGTRTWSDATAGQDLGRVHISGSSGKTVQLSSSVSATNVTIASGNTLSLGTGGNTLTILGDLLNENVLNPTTGTVRFARTSGSGIITLGSSPLFNALFDGAGGSWAFTNANITVNNNFTIEDGTVTMPTGTTTIAGNFANTGGDFMHNNGTIVFSNTAARTIQASGVDFHTLVFSGSGARSFVDTSATSSGFVRFQNGATTLPSGTFSIGRSMTTTGGGSFNANGGTVRLYANSGEIVTANNSPFAHLVFDGAGGSWAMNDASATSTGDVTILDGAVTLPGTRLSIGGSFDASGGTFSAGSGDVRFNSGTTGNTINPGSSSFSSVRFTNAAGGWTVVGNATTSGAWRLLAANTFIADSGVRISVVGEFENQIGGATTWTGSTLALLGGSYTVSDKAAPTESYNVLEIGSGAHVRMWNSSASTYTIDSSASLYSQDHGGVNGDLYIWGNYARTSGADHWSYETDFDGADISGGGERAVTVSLADSASVSIENATLSAIGTSTATTTVTRQSSGTYTLALTDSTVTLESLAVRFTDGDGLQILGSSSVSLGERLDFELGIEGGTLFTVSSTTLDANPETQIFGSRFALGSGITAGTNVALIGTPSSYWWFRESYGDLDGEAFDDDPGGDPGNIRWDDSSFLIDISGTVYNDVGTAAWSGCNVSVENLRLMVDGVPYDTHCDGSGAFVFSDVAYAGDVNMIAHLNTGGGDRGATVSRTPTGSVSGFDIYRDYTIVRHEDTAAMTIAQMADYDSGDDGDVPFTVSGGELTTATGTGLYIWQNKTFAPGGALTLEGGGAGEADGTLRMATSSTLTAAGSAAYTIGGSWIASSGSVFNRASSVVAFTATDAGNIIQPTSSFNELVFNGAGGGWSVDAPLAVVNDLTVTAGTLGGASNITVEDGQLSGAGTIAMTGGTVLLETSGDFGGASAWSFNNLSLGDGVTSGTTNTISSATTTIAGTLLIATAHTLEAGSSVWEFTGSGTVISRQGTFDAETSTFAYTSENALVVAPLTYYDLLLAATGGTPTYTLAAGGITVNRDLVIGNGANAMTATANTNDPLVIVSGDMTVRANATFVASNVNDTRLAGSYINEGTVTALSGSTLYFNANDTGHTIDLGESPLANVTFRNSAGGWTIVGNATATESWIIASSTSYTHASGTRLTILGTFENRVGGAATTWSGTTLSLQSGTTLSLNEKTVSDTYGTISVGANTQVRMWNSSAGDSYDIDPAGSLYSQDHAGNNGALTIWGNYTRSSGADYWSYATDFDGADLTGSERQVTVSLADNATTTLSGGSLTITGAVGNYTEIEALGSGTYALRVTGGTFSAERYQVRDINADGLWFSGTPTVTQLGRGNHLVDIEGGTSITVAASVINANPLRTFFQNNFALDGGTATGTNVTATGAPVSSWRFTQATGNLAGEAFDNDPGGDPGYIIWDDSDALIIISGNVYSDEGTTVSSVCDGSTNVVRMIVESATTSRITSCDDMTGEFAFVDVVFNVGDTITLYLDTDGGARAAHVILDPVTNVPDAHLYHERTVVRNENLDPITIADIAAYDSADDSDVPFTTTLSPNTLTLNNDHSLIVWNNRSFAPGGDVTLSATGSAAHNGTFELKAGATLTGASAQEYTVGGSWLMGSGAVFTANGADIEFTADISGRTIDTNTSAFGGMQFTGAGSWTFSATNATATRAVLISDGAVTLPTHTFALGASFQNTGGAFDAATNTLRFYAASAATIAFGGSDTHNLRFSGAGAKTITDTNATSTGDIAVTAGSVVFPSGTHTVGGSFDILGGTMTAPGTLRLISDDAGETITPGASSLSSLILSGGGSWTIIASSTTATGDVVIEDGSLTAPPVLFLIGGSLINTAGPAAFNANGGTLRFNAATGGHTIAPNGALLSNVEFDGASGGWEVTESATSSGYWYLLNGASYVQATGTTLTVEGIFNNLIGGSATNWTDSVLVLTASSSFSINTKTLGGDTYGTLSLGENTHIRAWDSSASAYDIGGSLYSQDHASVAGDLYIWGDYTRTSGTDHWSYATDFDGAALGGGSRVVTVRVANGSSVSYIDAELSILGTSGNATDIDAQSGSFALSVEDGTFAAEHFSLTGTNADGLSFLAQPSITSFRNGSFVLSVNGGTSITVAASVIDANPTAEWLGMSFATSSGVASGYNVTRTGSTTNIWTFVGATGPFAGEDFDLDGGDACGAIRWDDSLCLEVRQAHYRFRADDGGEGAPNEDWFDLDWSKRQRVTVTNPGSSAVTDAAIKLIVPYDGDMQSDFSDLRFTDAGGTTTIPHWFEEVVSGDEAEVWVRVPTLAASGPTILYMYYGNTVAANTSDGESVFLFFDDFESNSISGYSGADSSLFAPSTSYNYEGDYGLAAAAGQGGERTTAGGIYRTDMSFGPGSTIEFYQYVNTAQTNGPCVFFAVQTAGENYGVCLTQLPFDQVSLVRDVTSNDTSADAFLATSSVSYSTGWYRVVVDWLSDGTMDVSVYRDSDNSLAATLSAQDTTHDDGGGGFGFWVLQNAGWDLYTARPYLPSEPEYTFSLEQTAGGASWLAAQNERLTGQLPNQNFRYRVSVENSGVEVTDQEFALEWAAKTGFPSCQAVPFSNFATVPNQSSCGTSPLCMTASTEFSDQALTTQLLTTAYTGTFVAGRMVKSPSNQTNAFTLATSTLTELEYSIELTENANDSEYCLRVTNDGEDLDQYARIGELAVLFAPSISADWSLNNDQSIALIEGTTRVVYATGTVTDLNGFEDIDYATSTIYREGVGPNCTPDENNCYQDIVCDLDQVSASSGTVSCAADIQYFAEPTDFGIYSSERWFARLFVTDEGGETAIATTEVGVNVGTLRAISILTPMINFGTLGVGDDTGSENASSTVRNTGNIDIDLQISGSDLAAGFNSIPVGNIQYASSTFVYGGMCSICEFLSGTSTNFEIDLPKPTSSTTPITNAVFWGIAIPSNTAGLTYYGINTFTPVDN